MFFHNLEKRVVIEYLNRQIITKRFENIGYI